VVKARVCKTLITGSNPVVASELKRSLSHPAFVMKAGYFLRAQAMGILTFTEPSVYLRVGAQAVAATAGTTRHQGIRFQASNGDYSGQNHDSHSYHMAHMVAPGNLTG
jgi:hypothetical protein